MRLIDADSLRAVLKSRTIQVNGVTLPLPLLWEASIVAVDMQPTIDAVEVVRCKDCRLWMPVGKYTGKCPFLIGENQFTGDDHYCSCGERGEDDETD